jgi:hypothetical protein
MVVMRAGYQNEAVCLKMEDAIHEELEQMGDYRDMICSGMREIGTFTSYFSPLGKI